MISQLELAADFLEAVSDCPTPVTWTEGSKTFDAIVAPVSDQATLVWGGEKAGLHVYCIVAKSVFTSLPEQHQHFVIEGVSYRIHAINSSPIAPQLSFELHQQE